MRNDQPTFEVLRTKRGTESIRRWVIGPLSLLISYATTLVPVTLAYQSIALSTWTVRVVDSNGKPIQDATVGEFWQNYSFESQGHYIYATTDKDGIVTFPPANVKGTLGRRLFGPAMNFITYYLHGGYGLHAYLLAGKGDLRGSVEYVTGRELPAEITLKATPERD